MKSNKQVNISRIPLFIPSRPSKKKSWKNLNISRKTNPPYLTHSQRNHFMSRLPRAILTTSSKSRTLF